MLRRHRANLQLHCFFPFAKMYIVPAGLRVAWSFRFPGYKSALLYLRSIEPSLERLRMCILRARPAGCEGELSLFSPFVCFVSARVSVFYLFLERFLTHFFFVQHTLKFFNMTLNIVNVCSHFNIPTFDVYVQSFQLLDISNSFY